LDHDIGWAAHEITLTADEADGEIRTLTLPCRWVEYVQTWDGKGSAPFFLVSATHTDGLDEADWRGLAFTDALKKKHLYAVRDAEEVKPKVIRIMKVG
jgi:hypothetical protein